MKRENESIEGWAGWNCGVGRWKAFVAASLLMPSLGWGALVTVDFNGLNLTIPDGNLSGVQNSQVINSGETWIESLEVRLQISGRGGPAFNGDLYAYLTHDSGLAVLLNRPGRRAGSDYGYSDSGMQVTFDSGLSALDVHSYRLTLFGNQTTALGGALTGTWSADGRDVSPYDVRDTDGRTAPLSVFHGMNPNGTWTLFVADAEFGGAARLDGWGMTIHTGVAPVPEPASSAVLVGMGLGVIGLVRRWRERRR